MDRVGEKKLELWTHPFDLIGTSTKSSIFDPNHWTILQKTGWKFFLSPFPKWEPCLPVHQEPEGNIFLSVILKPVNEQGTERGNKTKRPFHLDGHIHDAVCTKHRMFPASCPFETVVRQVMKNQRWSSSFHSEAISCTWDYPPTEISFCILKKQIMVIILS